MTDSRVTSIRGAFSSPSDAAFRWGPKWSYRARWLINSFYIWQLNRSHLHHPVLGSTMKLNITFRFQHEARTDVAVSEAAILRSLSIVFRAQIFKLRLGGQLQWVFFSFLFFFNWDFCADYDGFRPVRGDLIVCCFFFLWGRNLFLCFFVCASVFVALSACARGLWVCLNFFRWFLKRKEVFKKVFHVGMYKRYNC